MIFNDFNNFMVLDPRFLGGHGTLIFLIFCLEICVLVRDLSRNVPGVFRSPGDPFINLFHLLFN